MLRQNTEIHNTPITMATRSDDDDDEGLSSRNLQRNRGDDASLKSTMSASAPDQHHHDNLLESRSRSNSPLSKSAQERRGGIHMRRKGIAAMAASSGNSSRRRIPQRNRSFQRSQSFKRTASGEALGATATHATAAQMQANAEKQDKFRKAWMESHQDLSSSRLNAEANVDNPAGPADTKGATKADSDGVRPAVTSLGFSTSTRDLGRQFDNEMDEEEGNYPLPPSLGARNAQHNTSKNERRQAINPLWFPPRRGSNDSTESQSSFTSRFASLFGGVTPPDKEPLGSTILADRDHRFRQAVDQSINLMDASKANYESGITRSDEYRPRTSSVRQSRSVSDRGGKQNLRKSVLDVMIGYGNEKTTNYRRKSSKRSRKSMVEIVLGPDPTRVQDHVLGRMSSGRNNKQSWWSKHRQTVLKCGFTAALLIMLAIAAILMVYAFTGRKIIHSDDATESAPEKISLTAGAIKPRGVNETKVLWPMNDTVDAVVSRQVSPSSSSNNSGTATNLKNATVDHTTIDGNLEVDNPMAHPLEAIVIRYNLTDQEDLRDPQSSASKALQWMTQHYGGIAVDDKDARGDGSIHWEEHRREIETYVLATLYYATHPPLDEAHTNSLSLGEQTTKSSSSSPGAGLRRRQLPSANSGGSSLRGDINEGTDWMEDDNICQWRGIRCGRDGFVAHLNLPHEHFHGTIPSELRGLKGLLELDLSHNHLHGSIPPEIGQLALMSTLLFHRNNLHGTVPDELGSLAQLKYFEVHGNDHLHGRIPTRICKTHTIIKVSATCDHLACSCDVCVCV